MIVRRLGQRSYGAGLALQLEARERVLGGGPDELLLLEHEPVVTLGRRGGVFDSARLADLQIPVVQTDRGGLATWHGPGQLTGYSIVDLRRRRLAVGDFVATLGRLLEELGGQFGVDARWDAERPGVYVGPRKLGSIGLHVHRGVTTHGFALNVDCDLAGFAAISPCGATDLTMTTLARESPRPVTVGEVEDAGASLFARPWPISATGA